MQVCSDVNVITLICTSFFGKIARTKSIFAHVLCVYDSTRMIIFIFQYFYRNYRSLWWYTICFRGSEYPWIKRCPGNIRHIYNKILSESIGVLMHFND